MELEIIMAMKTIKCPHCGKGKIIQVNEGWSSHTVNASCSGCHKSFTYTADCGRVRVTK